MKQGIYFSVSIFISIFVFSSCNLQQNEEYLIEVDTFSVVLADMHMADATLAFKGYNDKKLKDTLSSHYNYILVKHKITRDQFDSSMKYYSRNLVLYDQIYGKTQDILIGIKQRQNKRYYGMHVAKIVVDTVKYLIKNRKSFANNQDIWDQKRVWNLPTDGEEEAVLFEYVSFQHGQYRLTANLTYYSDDKTKKPRITLYAKYKDGTKTIKQIPIKKKDGNSYPYSLIINT